MSAPTSSKVLKVVVDEHGVCAVIGSRDLVREIRDALELLHNCVQEYFTKNSDHFLSKNLRELGEPTVWVPRNVDGLEDLPTKVTVHSAAIPRHAFAKPPEWFVEGCRKQFTNADWTGDYDEDSETAVTLFDSYVRGFGGETVLDHWGWLEQEDGNEVLVSEPYAFDSSLKVFMEFCESLGWVYKGRGVSGHAPGSTFRIEVYPKDQRRQSPLVDHPPQLTREEWQQRLKENQQATPRKAAIRSLDEVEKEWKRDGVS